MNVVQKRDIFSHPVIITGMHRSGTTLVSKLLEEHGVFFGVNKDINNESTFFLSRNEALLKYLGFGWHNIKEFRPNFDKKLVTQIYNDLNGLPIVNYLGIKTYLKYGNIFRFKAKWGWKDPRNTLLLPLWLQIFPKARIINVIRNGVDVANSLVVREQLRDKKNKNPNFKHGIARLYKKLDYIHVEKRYNANPLTEHRPNIELSESFQIWVDYISHLNHTQKIRNIEILNVKYEDIITNPEKMLLKINSFIGSEVNLEKIKNHYKRINRSRKFAFIENPELVQFYKIVKNHRFMKKFGYDTIKI